ncbi:MAG: tRNA epoxyqueuosine(34) reductase QueG [Acidobacteriota bacterium]
MATTATLDRTALTRRIVDAAEGLSFTRCAVAPVERLAAAIRLREWLSRDMHGSMGWMARDRERREDPAKVVAGARSVIVVAMNYFTPETSSDDRQAGRISRYAWGNEYHRVLGERLEKLHHRVLELLPTAVGRWYVDTGPVLEKAWAEHAGLGWIGKHTNLIVRDLSSWIFLGALILDQPLEYGAPHPDFCGTCNRCIEICPTRAIVAPYLLDARRCIAYLTIENHGPIPRQFRRQIGNHIFGCDDCQDVCPWNRFAKRSRAAKDFAVRPENRAPRLTSLLALSDEQFRHRFRDSPVRRAKRSGFVRNVAVALGNSGDRAAVPPLVEALDDPEPLVRGHVAWALGELGGERARSALAARLPDEKDPWVGEEIEAALAG